MRRVQSQDGGRFDLLPKVIQCDGFKLQLWKSERKAKRKGGAR